MVERIVVSAPGLRLDRFLALHVPGYSRAHWQGLIARGFISVDGKNRPADYRLQTGEAVLIRRPDYGWGEVPFEDWVLFEDPSLIAINKPVGLLMHPVGESWLKSPEAALAEEEPNLAGLLFRLRPRIVKSGAHRCGLVHRLDRDTSGVFVVAKTPEAQERLMAAFAERRTEKVYRAIVSGNLEGSIEVEAPLGRRRGGRRIAVTPWGKKASSAFKLVAAGRGVSLVDARPVTGRTHQIRAHFAYIRHPVLGDPDWKKDWEPALQEKGLPQPPRMMLHAYRLTVPHPKTGKPVRFTAPLPKDFKEYWRSLSG